MSISLELSQLINLGLTEPVAKRLIDQVAQQTRDSKTSREAWQSIFQTILRREYPFAVHQYIFNTVYPNWLQEINKAPAWFPTQEQIDQANITQFMRKYGLVDVKSLHEWSVNHPIKFWSGVLEALNIRFQHFNHEICDLTNGKEDPKWFPGSTFNIVESCIHNNSSIPALIYPDKNKKLCKMSYDSLDKLSNQIANSLVKRGLKAGDAIAIAMPMNHYAVAIYLGIIKMGGAVVSIADSFSSPEIETRLKIADTKAIFTQDFIDWGGKTLPLYEKFLSLSPLPTIVLSLDENQHMQLRPGDIHWQDFLVDDNQFSAIGMDPMSTCNILFSSGTTAQPKAIPWNHTTAIRAAMDAYFHQNIQAGDVLAWPTNLGWMMGPWIIFAALINNATLALYPDAPKDEKFGKFIEAAKVTMLGLVPTLVASWHQTKCMESCDFSAIKSYSSSGECSNPEDMLYLMYLANYRPIMEYCGGTEIGGAYLSSTIVEPNYPSLFTTPTMGMDVRIIDAEGHESNFGEIAIRPPSIGLSVKLLNAVHEKVYYDGMVALDGVRLRRHGDLVRRFDNGLYCLLGRVDDTMNLGGIKVSAAEIERVVNLLNEIEESAAISVQADQGPSELVIYAVTHEANPDVLLIQRKMQQLINSNLNPLFKIKHVVLIDALPKTASNKIMRRTLRDKYKPV